MTEPTTYTATVTDRHIERLTDETLVYDVASDRVLRLSADAALVWDACSVETTASDIGATTGLSSAQVDQALAALVDAELVAAEGPDVLTRRAFAAKAGLGVAAVAGAVLITTIAAPTPASAQSAPTGGGGGDN